MATPSETVIFYAVLIAPGFVAVMTTIILSAIEGDLSHFVLLISSLVSSLIIDAVFLGVYQWIHSPITSFAALAGILFNPYLRIDYVFIILGFSVFVGGVYAVVILLDLPGRIRRLLQSRAHIKVNPRQPWENFMRAADSVRIKTDDGDLYVGDVAEWSRAGREKELRIINPYYYHEEEQDYFPVGGPEMLFLAEDIDHILLRNRYRRPTLRHRIRSAMWSPSEGSTESEEEDNQETE